MCSGLSKLNSTLSQRELSRYIGFAVFFLSLVTYLSYFSIKYGLNVPPWPIGDEPSYDSIGWELSQGNGFSEDLNDPEFRLPYERAARENPGLPSLPHSKSGPTTVRPPLFPIVIATTDLLFGRQFWAVRIVNTLAIAATCGLISSALFQLAGILPALLGAFLFVMIDFHSRLYARAIMSEAIACLFVALLVLALFKFANTQQKRWVMMTAIMLGLTILSRNIFVLWIPGLAILLFQLQRTNLRAAISSVLLFVGVTMLIVSPWMIRNCVVLKSFNPTGTQGITQLSAGYSEMAWRHQGVWQNLDDVHFFDAVTTNDMTTIEKELARASYSRQKAVDWISHNPLKAIALAPLKIFHEFRPYTGSDTVVYFLAVFGLFSTRKKMEGKILSGLLVINMFAVAATWSVSGRFLVPLLFVIHVAAAIGLWGIIIWIQQVLQDGRGFV